MAHADSQPTTLYSSPISDCCARVRIALNLHKIPYELININLKTQENRNADFARINPSQTIPTLVHHGVTVTQSLAALEYIDETASDSKSLLPPDITARAQVRTLVGIIATDTHPLLTHRVGRAIDSMYPGGNVKAWRLQWLERGLQNFEAEVIKSSGVCCVGDIVSLADVVLVPALWTARRWDIPLERYSTIKRVYDHLMDMEELNSARQDPQSELDG